MHPVFSVARSLCLINDVSRKDAKDRKDAKNTRNQTRIPCILFLASCVSPWRLCVKPLREPCDMSREASGMMEKRDRGVKRGGV